MIIWWCEGNMWQKNEKMSGDVSLGYKKGEITILFKTIETIEVHEVDINKVLTPHPSFIVYDFEGVLRAFNIINNVHIPAILAIIDNLTNVSQFSDSINEKLIEKFMEKPMKRHKIITKPMNFLYMLLDLDNVKKPFML